MKYNKQTAQRLVGSMQAYENHVENSTRKLAISVGSTSGWRDNQYSEVRRATATLCSDVENAIRTLRDYADNLSQKIQELDG